MSKYISLKIKNQMVKIQTKSISVPGGKTKKARGGGGGVGVVTVTGESSSHRTESNRRSGYQTRLQMYPKSLIISHVPESSFIVLLQVRRDVPLHTTAFTPQLQRVPCRDRQRFPHLLKLPLPHYSIQVRRSCCGTRGLGWGRGFNLD